MIFRRKSAQSRIFFEHVEIQTVQRRFFPNHGGVNARPLSAADENEARQDAVPDEQPLERAVARFLIHFAALIGSEIAARGHDVQTEKADGIPVLAHPFGYGGIKYSPFELMENLRKLGVKGIEAFHGFNEPDEIEFIYKYCQFYGLLATMGSDTHEYYSNQGGRTDPGIAPGKSGESRFGKDNKIDESSLGTYNFHYFGTGAWRGEKKYDNMSIPETVIEHISKIKKKIEARELANQKQLQKLQNATGKQSQQNQ